MKNDTKVKNAHKHNPDNEKIKYKYRIHKKRSKRKDFDTIRADLLHIREFEIYIGFKGFGLFNDEVADRYIDYLFNQGYSTSYINDSLRALREFLNWLERQRGYRTKINYNHIEYLSLTDNQRKTAKAVDYKLSYKFAEIIKTIRTMPKKTLIEKRNVAIISLQALCGLRISELRTIRVKSLIFEDGVWFIDVNPKYMRVKNSKQRNAYFMKLPDDIVQNILAWRDYLVSIGFKPLDCLFPIIPSKFNQYNIIESKVDNAPIKSNTTLRDVFKKAFTSAGYEYLNPHSFRKTHARYAEGISKTFYNAVSKSLGHSTPAVTDRSYGDISVFEQQERYKSLEGVFK
jgi:integrase